VAGFELRAWQIDDAEEPTFRRPSTYEVVDLIGEIRILSVALIDNQKQSLMLHTSGSVIFFVFLTLL
jgi:hypothetical protein